jgi:hypothetical protein
MSVEYLMSICKEAQPKELAYQIGLAVHKGLSEDAVWVALEPILDHRIMADVISRMGSVRRRDAEEEAELALASHPLLDLSPRLQILVLRALLRKHLFDENPKPVATFVDRLRTCWNDEARVQRMCEIADTLVDIPFGRMSGEWEDLLESTPPVECHQPYLDQATTWSFSAPTWTDDEIYRFIRSSTAHCRECEELALATVGEERMDLIAERIWQAQLAEEMVEGVYKGY